MSARLKWTEEQLDFLKENFPKMYLDQLEIAFIKHFGLVRTRQQLHSCVRNHKIRSGRSTGRKGPSNPNAKYSQEHLDFLQENYPNLTQKELLEAFSQKFFPLRETQLVGILKNRKMASGRTGHFRKGSVPWNVLMKGTGRIKANAGSFQPLQKPLNAKPLGYESIDRDGYVKICVDKVNPYTGAITFMEFKHKHIWEQANGPVPEGMAIMFKDGNKLNCVLDNLILVSRAELALLNRWLKYYETPSELKPAVLTLARLKLTIGRLQREQKESA